MGKGANKAPVEIFNGPCAYWCEVPYARITTTAATCRRPLDKSARVHERFPPAPDRHGAIHHRVLTDNGKEFTDRLRITPQASVEHRLIIPKIPQTSGMIERFNGVSPRSWPPPALTPPSTWSITSKLPANATSRSTINTFP